MRERYWLPFEDKLTDAYPYGGVEMELKSGIEELDGYMHEFCGVEEGRTKESIYRLLGWLSNSAKMKSPGGVPHDASTGSAKDTD